MARSDTKGRRQRSWTGRRAALALLALAGFALALFLSVFAPHDTLRRWELYTYDGHVRALPPGAPDPRIVLVGLDEETLSRLPGLERPFYPLPRAYHARASDALREAGGRVIGFDLMFLRPQPDDRALADAFRRHGRVVTALGADSEVAEGREYLTFTPPVPPVRAAATPASILLPRGFGNRARWLAPYAADSRTGERWPHLAFAVTAAYHGELAAQPRVTGDAFTWGRMRVPLGVNGQEAWLRFDGPPGTYRYVPFHELYDGSWRKTRPADTFRDRIVLVGAVLPMEDRHDTPVGQMAGLEVLANAAAMALRGNYVRPVSALTTALIGTGLSLLFVVALARLPLAAALLVGVGVGALWAGLSRAVFPSGLYLPTVEPLLTLAATTAAGGLYGAATTRTALRRFLPAWAADRALSGDVESAGLIDRPMTVVFCDIRGFTALSERLSPDDLNALLTDFYRAGEENARRYGTELDKFIGDTILVYFPEGRRGSEPHEVRALRWALAMRESARGIDRDGRAGETGFGVRIGIASGVAREGLVGGQDRRQATVIGDVVNTASRLCDAAREAEGDILMSERTFSQVREVIPSEPVGAVAVKGKREPVAVFAPRDAHRVPDGSR